MGLTEFQKKALEIDKHISLTANAGSGKTFVLAKRFVEIALKENIHLNKIAAITFTEKAAGELYVKISDEINERINIEENPENKKKLQRIRNQLVSANISTIHSFCNNLLKEFAPEIGVDSNFAVMDANVSKDLIDRVIAEYVEVLINNSDDSANRTDLFELIRIFGSIEILVANLKFMFNNRKTVLKLKENIYNNNVSEIARRFHILANKHLDKLLKINLNLFLTNLIAFNAQILEAKPDNKTANAFLEMCSQIDIEGEDLIVDLLKIKNLLKIITTQKGTIRKNGYARYFKGEGLDFSPGDLQEKIDLIFQLQFDEEFRKSEHALAVFGKLLMNIFTEIFNKYETKKRELSFLDLEDLLLYTLELLKIKEVREALSNKYRHILVDEYQDTNEVQFEIIMPLLDELNKGKLFVVGDAKQSIYMFREAELEVFGRTTEKIKDANNGPGVVELPHSFRLAPYLALFTNQVFKRIFANPNPIFNEVGYSPLISTRDISEGGKVEFLVAEKPEEEAGLIAKRIIQLKKETSIKLESIAILCHRRDWFDILAKSLNEHHLPFTIIGSKGFFQNQVIADVYNYLAFLLDPDDDAALVGLLRSPFFFLSDEDLFKISQEKGESYFEKLRKYATVNEEFLPIVEQITNNVEAAKALPLNKLLHRVVIDSGYYSVIASRKDFPNQLANLKKLLNISVEFRNESFNSYYDFVEYLKNSIRTNAEEGEADFVSKRGAIQIMTIHQAKGLEFEAVFIFKAHERLKLESIKAREVIVNKNFGLITKVPVENDYFSQYRTPPIASIVQYYQRKKQLAEFKRLFYVAVTRAKNYLFISWTLQSNPPAASFLGLLRSALDFNSNDSYVFIEGSLKILDSIANSEVEKVLKLKVPIVKETDLRESEIGEELKLQESEEWKITIKKIRDVPEREIFSATRISIYLQCPRKYKLIYELGMGKLLQILSSYKADLTNNEDKDEYLPSNIIGTVIHSALEKEVSIRQLNQFVENELMKYSFNNDDSGISIKNITGIIEKYLRSETANEINSFKNYFNEFNIYVKHNNHYLFGIPDKLIITDEAYIIVDYKTDIIKKNEARKKFLQYANQLMFYAFIVNKYFNVNKKIFVKLIFVREPSLNLTEEITEKKLKDFENIINTVITSVRNQYYPANKGHCKDCQFFKNERCIVPE